LTIVFDEKLKSSKLSFVIYLFFLYPVTGTVIRSSRSQAKTLKRKGWRMLSTKWWVLGKKIFGKEMCWI